MPPVVIPPNPKAGGRTTNGLVWVEDIGVDTGALVMDYAVIAFFSVSDITKKCDCFCVRLVELLLMQSSGQAKPMLAISLHKVIMACLVGIFRILTSLSVSISFSI